MPRLLKYASVATLVAVVLVALAAISPASAKEAVAEALNMTARIATVRHGGGFGRGMCGQAGLEAAAEALDMTADELSTQLWGGNTLADLADKAGVDLQAVRDAVDGACTQATRDAIEQAVTDGSLSRAQADWLLEGLENGYLGGNGFGWGGFHDGGPRGFFRPSRSGFRGFGLPRSSTTSNSSGF